MQQPQYKKYMHSRRNGFSMNLYRNIDQKKLGGVCSGLADHFEIDHNIMRLVFIAGFLFTNAIAFWAYVGAWIVLVPKPINLDNEHADRSAYEYDEEEKRYRKKKIFRYQENTGIRIARAKNRLNDIVNQVDTMERYVTSNKYNLHRQFADLEK